MRSKILGVVSSSLNTSSYLDSIGFKVIPLNKVDKIDIYKYVF